MEIRSSVCFRVSSKYPVDFFIYELKINNKMFAVELSYLTITEKYNKNTIIRRRKTFT